MQIAGPDSAFFYRKIEPDTTADLFKVSDYYMDNKIRFTGHSTKPSYAWLQGECTTYFQNGSKKEVAQYDKGERVGDIIKYFPNCKVYLVFQYVNENQNISVDDFTNKPYIIKSNYDSLGKQLVMLGNGTYKGYDNEFNYVSDEGNVKDGRRDGEWKAITDDGKTHLQESYSYGLLLSGTATYKNVNISSYKNSRTVAPKYRGGMDEFYKYLGNTIQYPKMDRKNGIQGRVIATFVVEKDGQLSDVKLLRSVSAGIDAEAVRALQQCPKWEPAMRFGYKVRVQYTVPIVFALKG